MADSTQVRTLKLRTYVKIDGSDEYVEIGEHEVTLTTALGNRNRSPLPLLEDQAEAWQRYWRSNPTPATTPHPGPNDTYKVTC